MKSKPIDKYSFWKAVSEYRKDYKGLDIGEINDIELDLTAGVLKIPVKYNGNVRELWVWDEQTEDQVQKSLDEQVGEIVQSLDNQFDTKVN